MQVGEIAAPTAGHQDFFAHLIGTFQNQHTPPTPGRSDRTQQSGSTCADNNQVWSFHVWALWLETEEYAHRREPRCPSLHFQFSRLYFLIHTNPATLHQKAV
jgi:hypothetical protein